MKRMQEAVPMRNGESVRKLKFSEQTDEFVGEQLSSKYYNDG